MESNDQLNRETQIAATLLIYLNQMDIQRLSGQDSNLDGWKRQLEEMGVDVEALEPLIRPLMKSRSEEKWEQKELHTIDGDKETVSDWVQAAKRQAADLTHLQARKRPGQG